MPTFDQHQEDGGQFPPFAAASESQQHCPYYQVDEDDDDDDDEEVENSLVQVNQYQILFPIGKGCQGSVFLALDTNSNEVRALKQISKPITTSSIRSKVEQSRHRRRLMQEISVMKRCRHPNLVTLYEVIDDPEARHVYLILKFVEHGNLVSIDEVTGAASKSLPVGQVIRCAAQLCSALQYLHERRIVHCDIKSENVLLGQDDVVYLADFGVSRLFPQPPPPSPTPAPQQPQRAPSPSAATANYTAHGSLISSSTTPKHLQSNDQSGVSGAGASRDRQHQQPQPSGSNVGAHQRQQRLTSLISGVPAANCTFPVGDRNNTSGALSGGMSGGSGGASRGAADFASMRMRRAGVGEKQHGAVLFRPPEAFSAATLSCGASFSGAANNYYNNNHISNVPAPSHLLHSASNSPLEAAVVGGNIISDSEIDARRREENRTKDNLPRLHSEVTETTTRSNQQSSARKCYSSQRKFSDETNDNSGSGEVARLVAKQSPPLAPTSSSPMTSNQQQQSQQPRQQGTRPTSSPFSPQRKGQLHHDHQPDQNRQRRQLPQFDDELERLKAADVWALGLTIFACLYQRLPFGNGTRRLDEFAGLPELLEHIADPCQPVEFPAVCAFDGTPVPAGVVAALAQMLRKDPAKRCSAAEANNSWLRLHEMMIAREREKELDEWKQLTEVRRLEDEREDSEGGIDDEAEDDEDNHCATANTTAASNPLMQFGTAVIGDVADAANSFTGERNGDGDKNAEANSPAKQPDDSSTPTTSNESEGAASVSDNSSATPSSSSHQLTAIAVSKARRCTEVFADEADATTMTTNNNNNNDDDEQVDSKVAVTNGTVNHHNNNCNADVTGAANVFDHLYANVRSTQNEESIRSSSSSSAPSSLASQSPIGSRVLANSFQHNTSSSHQSGGRYSPMTPRSAPPPFASSTATKLRRKTQLGGNPLDTPTAATLTTNKVNSPEHSTTFRCEPIPNFQITVHEAVSAATPSPNSDAGNDSSSPSSPIAPRQRRTLTTTGDGNGRMTMMLSVVEATTPLHASMTAAASTPMLSTSLNSSQAPSDDGGRTAAQAYRRGSTSAANYHPLPSASPNQPPQLSTPVDDVNTSFPAPRLQNNEGAITAPPATTRMSSGEDRDSTNTDIISISHRTTNSSSQTHASTNMYNVSHTTDGPLTLLSRGTSMSATTLRYCSGIADGGSGGGGIVMPFASRDSIPSTQGVITNGSERGGDGGPGDGIDGCDGGGGGDGVAEDIRHVRGLPALATSDMSPSSANNSHSSHPSQQHHS